MKIKHYQ